MENIKYKSWKFKIGEKICKIFGHRFDFIEKTILDIKDKAENRKDFLDDYICCKNCGGEFNLKT